MNEEFTLLDAMEAVDEYLETAYIERIYCEGMSPFFESEKDFNDFLKDHDYDPKSKTIKYDNKRVPIGSLDDFIRSCGDTPNPMSRYLYNNQIQYSPAFAYTDEKNKLRGVHYTDAMKKLNRRDIEYIMGHEYGHIKDLADERKANRAMSFLAKYNYTAIPKEDRREFLEIKKLERSGKSLSEGEKKRISEFKKKLQKDIQNTALYKNDKDIQARDKYEREKRDAETAIKKKIGVLGMKHDKNYREIKADAEGFRQTKKALDKKATPNRSLNKAVKNMIPSAIDNAVDYNAYRNNKKTSDAKRKALHVAAKVPKGLVVGGSAAYAGKAIKDSVPIRKRIKELKNKEELTPEEKAELSKLKTKLKSYNKKAIAGAAIGTAASVGIIPILNKPRINASNYYYKRHKND